MSPAEALRDMVVETGTEQACADAIAAYEGWVLGERARRERFMQCLRHQANRHVEADWLPLVLRIVARAGGRDLVTGILDAARRDGEHDADLERRGLIGRAIVKVTAPSARRERSTA